MSTKVDPRIFDFTQEEIRLQDMEAGLLAAKTPQEKLIICSQYGNVPLATELLKLDVTINPDPNTFTLSPLYIAVCHGQFEMVKFLIGHGANVNEMSRACGYTTLLNLAIIKRSLDIFTCLLENGADVNARYKMQNTSLHKAACLAEYDMGLADVFISKLLAAGATIQLNDRNYTPIALASILINYNCLLSDEEKSSRIGELKTLISGSLTKISTPITTVSPLISQSSLFSNKCEPESTGSVDDWVLINNMDHEDWVDDMNFSC